MTAPHAVTCASPDRLVFCTKLVCRVRRQATVASKDGERVAST